MLQILCHRGNEFDSVFLIQQQIRQFECMEDGVRNGNPSPVVSTEMKTWMGSFQIVEQFPYGTVADFILRDGFFPKAVEDMGRLRGDPEHWFQFLKYHRKQFFSGQRGIVGLTCSTNENGEQYLILRAAFREER